MDKNKSAIPISLKVLPYNNYSLRDKIHSFLISNHINVALTDLILFVKEVDRSKRKNDLFPEMQKKRTDKMDIIHFILDAKEADDQDETLWRTFLAAHFGYLSANNQQMLSASQFLCAFGSTPVWTWKRVSNDFSGFANWLCAEQEQLKTLQYGNHRKYGPKQAHLIENVIYSFITWTNKHGGTPTQAFMTEESLTPRQRFGTLYDRFDVLGFGRTGKFDLLYLMGILNIQSLERNSCYITGSTGPFEGAKRLFGEKDKKEFEFLADALADELSVSYAVIEDALCNWQKH